MNHEPAQWMPSDRLTPKLKRPMAQCPVCKRHLPATPSKPCTGKKPCAPCDPPPLATQVWSFAKAVAEFVADGLRTVDGEEYARRLAICEGCERHENGTCLVCNCNLSVKASWRSSKCPHPDGDKWSPGRTEIPSTGTRDVG